VELPERGAKPFKPGEGVKHGYYMHNQPPEEVAKVLQEDIQGIEEEIVGLRRLERGLLEQAGRTENNLEKRQLWKAYNLMAFRLAEMIKAETGLAQEGEEIQRVKDFLERMAKQGTWIEELEREAMEGELELRVDSRRLREEIAGKRYVLRQVFKQAIEALKEEETQDAIQLAEIYSSGCLRLVQMLRMEKPYYGQMDEVIRKNLNEALLEAYKGWKITNPDLN